MARRYLNLLVRGRYPVYVGQFDDGSTLSMSFPTSAKLYAEDGTVEFANGRRLVHQVKNPSFVYTGRATWKANNAPVRKLVAGWVRLSDTETVADPMTDTKPTIRRNSSKELKALILELADALENRVNDVDDLLARARQLAT